MNLTRRSLLTGAGTLAAATVLAACSSSDPLSGAPAEGGDNSTLTTIVIGSQQYYSNEIIAEVYAQAIEHAGLGVDRQFQIGQREIYMPELASGALHVIPEYTGNLLQHLDGDASATDADALHAALEEALPEGLTVYRYAEATDQDSYTVTAALAQEHGLVTVADLASLGRTVKVAANSEFATRPYGPQGLKRVYGVDAEVTPVEDSGGPLTVKALLDGDVDVADIYTSDPAIEDNGLVVLEDPKGLILPQHVVPVAAEGLPPVVRTTIELVQASLTTSELRALNKRSTSEGLDAARIAADWLSAQDMVG
ncbi:MULTISPECIES: ABC transporter substrate-binding protein [unclassified Actinomyces]|uniref:ABC transporter substrate-binding protein n=1 Tax=unclassified Actinomyces TaxID=2609248 RepID=UPI0020171B4A|nr:MULTISPECIES: ABC transporter substrate-binding protein [unclassified Actinomyces]MCL3778044.1 ABC transporter substrate-binding protein [Actinomyces sp. AC-20-1]MCL3789870.1 ABC transporter substrate-binding protein [Actinomyces sp. 187325]MCL3792025.1 ABC transporter substrate-binding protein [Actinomyces sp. 186855]MCL3794727.1 ABC transporter substrate-binding protein [Actinomyces sp. 217892]